ncbi:hypothetical protein J4Z08_20930 [Citrobacter portucalensis]|uniref:hypothetical protein n=1 Tax=Citrobacter portucalensis TaxID=1639133 RepID=UPI003140B958
MSTKIIGLILILGGIIAIALLWLLQKAPSSSSGTGSTSRYRLSHEFEKKGLTEKGQSEGMRDVPQSVTPPSYEHFKNDPYFTSGSESNDTPPGDNF